MYLVSGSGLKSAGQHPGVQLLEVFGLDTVDPVSAKAGDQVPVHSCPVTGQGLDVAVSDAAGVGAQDAAGERGVLAVLNLNMSGRRVGLGFDGRIMSGWASMGQTREEAEKTMTSLIESEGLAYVHD